MFIPKVRPPNWNYYIDRCEALERALKSKDIMPPFLIVHACQSLLYRAIGGPWRVIWLLILERLDNYWDRAKQVCWWNWRMYVLLETHEEIMEAWAVWLEKKAGDDCRDWPNEIFIEEESEL